MLILLGNCNVCGQMLHLKLVLFFGFFVLGLFFCFGFLVVVGFFVLVFCCCCLMTCFP